jgi:hypothetical protein
LTRLRRVYSQRLPWYHIELWLNLGDAAWSGGAVCCVADGDTVGELDAIDDERQLIGALQPAPFFEAARTKVKTISFAVLCESAPLVRTVRCRTVAKTLSIGLAVRR